MVEKIPTEMRAALPRATYNHKLSRNKNIFRENFGRLTSKQWLETLLEAEKSPVIRDIEFPLYPDQDLQQTLHGAATLQSGLQEAFRFHDFVKLKSTSLISSENNFLDFGCGWGRMTRPFLRDFDLQNIYGFEPNLAFAAIARSLNPYVSVLSGDFLPNNTLPQNKFDLIIGWSVFSHLSWLSASSWISEFSQAMRPGALCVMTTWGIPFLDRLASEQRRFDNGETIHYYSEIQLKKAGNIDRARREFEETGFLFWGEPTDLYGTTFLGATGLLRIIEEADLPLEIEFFDNDSLAQTTFGLRRL